MTRHWTPEVDAEAAALYQTFTTAKIRRFQDLTRSQIMEAHARGLDDALADLQAQDNALFREMSRRLARRTSR